jgi:hypothetical protein
MTTNPQDLDAPQDVFLALTSVKAVYFTELCHRLLEGKSSENEAVTAIRDLCKDNERLAVLAGKRAAEKAEVVAENATLRRDLLAAEDRGIQIGLRAAAEKLHSQGYRTAVRQILALTPDEARKMGEV